MSLSQEQKGIIFWAVAAVSSAFMVGKSATLHHILVALHLYHP